MTKLDDLPGCAEAPARVQSAGAKSASRTRRKAPRTGQKNQPAGASPPASPPNRTSDPMMLGPALTIREAMSLKQELREILDAGRPVYLDGGAVLSTDTAGLQLLAAFVLEAKTRKLEIAWRGASQVLLQSAARLGLAALIGLAAPEETEAPG